MTNRVYFTNHGYYAEQTFETLDEAIAYGKRHHFDFSVQDEDGLRVGYGVFSGLRYYRESDRRAAYGPRLSPIV